MNDLALVLAVLGGGLALIYFVAKYFEQRSKNQGALFTRSPSRSSRILAFLLAILFGGASLLQILSTERVSVVLPFLSLIALLYAFGATKTLTGLQSRKNKGRNDSEK